jgi:hypothetical protein
MVDTSNGNLKKMSAKIIDAHIHIYRTSEQGHRGKEEYEIWEYGEKEVTLSHFGGSPEEALTAIQEAGAERAVVVNLCGGQPLLPVEPDGGG